MLIKKPLRKSLLMDVQDVRWDKGGNLLVDHTFFYGKGDEKHQLGTEFLYTRE
jgi:hypothetical protein